MRKLTLEQKLTMDRAIKFAPVRQILIWMWWEVFLSPKSR
jgi:hypothetical protein